MRFNPFSSGICERETRGLLAATAEHPRATLHVIALDATGAQPLPDNVLLHSAGDRLLEPGDQANPSQ